MHEGASAIKLYLGKLRWQKLAWNSREDDTPKIYTL